MTLWQDAATACPRRGATRKSVKDPEENHHGNEGRTPGFRCGGCRCPSRRPCLEIWGPLGAKRHWSQSQVCLCTCACAFAVIILTDFDGCSLRGGGPLSLEQAQMVTTGLNCVQVHLISAVACARHLLLLCFRQHEIMGMHPSPACGRVLQRVLTAVTNT